MFRKTVILVVAFVLLVVSAFLTSAQDENPLPEPTGSYDVGRTIYHLIDEDRPEILTEDEDDVRELVVYAFYPADVPEGAEPAPYINDELMVAMQENLELYSTFEFVMSAAKTHSYDNAPILTGDAPYPVILLIPEYNTDGWGYVSYAEDLASNGYIVLAMSHPYHNPLVMFPDGKVITAPETDNDADFVLRIWSQDAQFVLDSLVDLNENDDVLAGMLNLEQIGMVGHLWGGTIGLWLAQNDERIDAFVISGVFNHASWDCELCQEMLETPTDIPLLMLAWFLEYNFPLPEAGLVADGTYLYFEGDYMAFSDYTLLWEIQTRKTNLERTKKIRAYLLAFLDEHVKGIDGAMLEEDSETYPRVYLRKIE